MSVMLQNILAGLIVSVAIGYVLLRLWRLIRGSSAGHCGGCRGCAVSKIAVSKIAVSKIVAQDQQFQSVCREHRVEFVQPTDRPTCD